jgi:hypothetical protein
VDGPGALPGPWVTLLHVARSLQSLSGVFLGSHAVAAGAVTRTQLQSGLYRRLFHNVYADPGLPVDHRLYARGATLVMPVDAVLGGRSAAAWFDAPFATPTDPVLVVVPPDSAWRGPRGLRVHRTDVTATDVVTVDDSDGVVRLTTLLRTAWEIGTQESLATAVALLDAMVRASHVDEASLARLARQSRGQWGSRRFEKVARWSTAAARAVPSRWCGWRASGPVCPPPCRSWW